MFAFPKLSMLGVSLVVIGAGDFNVVHAAPASPTTILPPAMSPPPEVETRSGNFLLLDRLTAPSQIAGEKLRIGSAILADGLPEMAQSNREFTEGLSGKTFTLKQIYDAASSLEQAYARAGFVFVRIVVPPQRLQDGGDVNFSVVNGFIENIVIDKVPARYRASVEARLRPLIGRRSIKIAEVERRVLLAGDLPGLLLSSALTQGEQDGGVVLVLEGESEMVAGSVSIDNRLPDNLGTYQHVTSLYVNNPTGHGERVYLVLGSSISGDDFNLMTRPSGFQSLGLQVPVGVSGWMINPEYINYSSIVAATSGLPQTEATYTRSTIRVIAPLVRERAKIVNFSLGVEQVYYLSRFPVFKTDDRSDKYRVARSAIDLSMRVSDQTSLQSKLEYSNGLGGRSVADGIRSNIPLSRQGASPRFSSLKASGVLQQSRPDSFAIKLFATAQTSFGSALLSSEQLSLEGANAINGLSAGSASVDEGFVVRSELSYPITVGFLSSRPSLEPYVFVAGGVGYLNKPTSVERPTIRAKGAGAGLRMPLPVSDTSLSLEYAQAYTNLLAPMKRSSHRVGLSLLKRF